ncbi:MAG: hypothetical protein IIT72_06215, partial [Lachnospiraceae bacterium]|nr:hypothetical protein [Lachnospiraceae bacterium]
LNHRNVADETERVGEFAAENGLRIVADIPRDPAFQTAEDQGKTVVELDASSELSGRFLALAKELLEASDGDDGTDMSIDPDSFVECEDCV